MEEGIEPEEIKILSNPEDIQLLYRNLIQTALSEISLIIPTRNTLSRQHEIGLTDLIKKAAIEKNVQINIAIPRYEMLKQLDVELKVIHPEEVAADNLNDIEELPLISQNIIIRKFFSSINQTSEMKSTILLVDRQSCLVIDLKDDSSDKFSDAIGLATYFKTKSCTQSYGFIFDTIWMQAGLYRQLELRTIELEKLNAMQNEFVNIAAHELRTPAQAILGYSEMLAMTSDMKTSYGEAIMRNAQRLYSLTTDMLDVARIESQTLRLDNSNFDLNQEIENVIKDVMETAEWAKISNDVRFVFEAENSTILFGDRQRIHQVILNLVNNALKFTKKGTITIGVEKNSQTDDTMVTITDTGTGIDSEILSRIFTKFATKSKSGTGLGLFISKAIVEAHGGSLQAQNNVDGKGAMLSFTIPHIEV
jgi:two-component system sensor histidine kinase VicK